MLYAQRMREFQQESVKANGSSVRHSQKSGAVIQVGEGGGRKRLSRSIEWRELIYSE